MQKFSLIHNCHFKFAESNDKRRTNRDRPGGHVCNQIISQGWKDYCGPDARKYSKKVFAKATRRESKRIIAEGVADWNEVGDLMPCELWGDWSWGHDMYDDSEFDADWDEYREEYGDMEEPYYPDWDLFDDYESHLDTLDDDYYYHDIWDGEDDLDEESTITITVSEYNALLRRAKGIE